MRFSVRLATLALAAALATTACPHPAPGPNGPVVTPVTWVDTAHSVLDALRWMLPAANIAVALTPVAPATKAEVQRVLVELAHTTVPAFADAVNVYQARGGAEAKCRANAAAGAITTALVGVARTLSAQGFSLGADLENMLSAVGGLADELTQACPNDAGFSSVGVTASATLRALSDGARARGVALRPLVLQRTDAGL